eukprot:351773-Chlamydomonas_euryale.AAC.5
MAHCPGAKSITKQNRTEHSKVQRSGVEWSQIRTQPEKWAQTEIQHQHVHCVLFTASRMRPPPHTCGDEEAWAVCDSGGEAIVAGDAILSSSCLELSPRAPDSWGTQWGAAFEHTAGVSGAIATARAGTYHVLARMVERAGTGRNSVLAHMQTHA